MLIKSFTLADLNPIFSPEKKQGVNVFNVSLIDTNWFLNKIAHYQMFKPCFLSETEQMKLFFKLSSLSNLSNLFNLFSFL